MLSALDILRVHVLTHVHLTRKGRSGIGSVGRLRPDKVRTASLEPGPDFSSLVLHSPGGSGGSTSARSCASARSWPSPPPRSSSTPRFAGPRPARSERRLVDGSNIVKLAIFWPMFANFWRVRSRLYRSRFLRRSMPFLHFSSSTRCT